MLEGKIQLSKKNKGKQFLILMILFLGLIVVYKISVRHELQSQVASEGQNASLEMKTIVTRADQETEYTNAVPIELSAMQGAVMIENAGEYLLSGELEGNICIDVEEQIVHLFLDNVKINSSDGPAIRIDSAGKVIITLLEGTENYLYDSGKYQVSDEEDACIYSVCDLTINGNGLLEIYGYFKDAVHVKDKVKIINNTIKVKAKREGIRANDGIYIDGANVNIECENDGVRTTNSGDDGRGAIEILNSYISVIAGRYAINSQNNIVISNTDEVLKGIVSNYYENGKTYSVRETIQNE